ncbi:MAG: exodeoxyribonuclease III, partial [Alphaproteobacteria bacterium]|nr:exodeoxyribonuclease III [Alphaproteobacteria bacterium]
MLRLISLNLNGLRSAAGKGLLAWLGRQRADVLCMQEVKAQPQDLEPRLLAPRGWHATFHCAQRKGYSGVAIWSRRAPDRVVEG